MFTCNHCVKDDKVFFHLVVYVKKMGFDASFHSVLCSVYNTSHVVTLIINYSFLFVEPGPSCSKIFSLNEVTM